MPPRPVYHLADENYVGDSPYGGTLCERDATHRYRFSSLESFDSNGFRNYCPRCREKAIRLGLIEGTPSIPPERQRRRRSSRSTGSVSFEEFDNQMDTLLQRMGVLEYVAS